MPFLGQMLLAEHIVTTVFVSIRKRCPGGNGQSFPQEYTAYHQISGLGMWFGLDFSPLLTLVQCKEMHPDR